MMKIDKMTSIENEPEPNIFSDKLFSKKASAQTNSTSDFHKYGYRSSNIHRVVLDSPSSKDKQRSPSPGISPYKKQNRKQQNASKKAAVKTKPEQTSHEKFEK